MLPEAHVNISEFFGKISKASIKAQNSLELPKHNLRYALYVMSIGKSLQRNHVI